MNSCVCVSVLSEGAAGACLPGNPGVKRASGKQKRLQDHEWPLVPKRKDVGFWSMTLREATPSTWPWSPDDAQFGWDQDFFSGLRLYRGSTAMTYLAHTAHAQLGALWLGCVGWTTTAMALGLIQWRVWVVSDREFISSGVAWVGVWRVCFNSHTLVTPDPGRGRQKHNCTVKMEINNQLQGYKISNCS